MIIDCARVNLLTSETEHLLHNSPVGATSFVRVTWTLGHKDAAGHGRRGWWSIQDGLYGSAWKCQVLIQIWLHYPNLWPSKPITQSSCTKTTPRAVTVTFLNNPFEPFLCPIQYFVRGHCRLHCNFIHVLCLRVGEDSERAVCQIRQISRGKRGLILCPNFKHAHHFWGNILCTEIQPEIGRASCRERV